MTSRSKGTLLLITMALVALALGTMLPTAVFASPNIDSERPWRGDGLAIDFVYGH